MLSVSSPIQQTKQTSHHFGKNTRSEFGPLRTIGNILCTRLRKRQVDSEGAENRPDYRGKASDQ
jgi:hypothetical protein